MSMVGEKIGSIRVIERIGCGGMGEVYVGIDEKLDRRVAIKSIRGDRRLDDRAKARLRREAQVLAKLEHPNICRLYDLIEDESGDCLIMELVKGQTLKNYLEKPAKYSVKLKIASEIAQALSAAHTENIVHRDLKPENIMITDSGQVKVLDYGLARALAEGETEIFERGEGRNENDEYSGPGFQTERGVITGTPLFMSPEQARCEEISVASDIYSFGLLLHWLFVEDYAYPRDVPAQQLLFMVMNAKSKEVQGQNRDLTNLIERMKSANSQLRPTAVEVTRQLDWIEQKPRRKRRALLASLFVVLLVVVTFVSLFGFFSVRKANRETQRALAETQAVSGFMQDMLTAANPTRDGYDVKVLDVIEQAASRVDTEFSDHPEKKAAVLTMLGETFFELGLYPRSEMMHRQALQIKESLFGERHPSTLHDLNRLGSALSESGKFGEAEAVLMNVIETRTDLQGESHKQTILALIDLAVNMDRQGRDKNAEEVCIRLLEQIRRIPNADDFMVLAAKATLAGVITVKERAIEAENLWRELLPESGRIYGEEHPGTWAIMTNLALCLGMQERHDDARDILEQVVDLSEKKMGPRHPHALKARENLANTYGSLGEHGLADEIYRQNIRIRTEDLGETHWQTLDSVENRAVNKILQGRLQECEAPLKRVLELRIESVGSDQSVVVKTLRNLAMLYDLQERFKEAFAYEIRALNIEKKIKGVHHLDVVKAMTDAVSAGYSAQEYARVEVPAMECKNIIAEKFPSEITLAAKVDAYLGAIRAAQGKFDVGERQLLDAISKTRQTDPDNKITIELDGLLGRVYEQHGNLERAIPVYVRAAEKGHERSIKALKRLGNKPNKSN